jgi:hypothetical protein
LFFKAASWWGPCFPAQSVASSLLRASSSKKGRGREESVGVLPCRLGPVVRDSNEHHGYTNTEVKQTYSSKSRTSEPNLTIIVALVAFHYTRPTKDHDSPTDQPVASTNPRTEPQVYHYSTYCFTSWPLFDQLNHKLITIRPTASQVDPYSTHWTTSWPLFDRLVVQLVKEWSTGGSSGRIVVNSWFSWSNSDELVVQVVIVVNSQFSWSNSRVHQFFVVFKKTLTFVFFLLTWWWQLWLSKRRPG